MANESARGLILPVSILVAVAVGVVIGSALVRPSDPSPRPPVAEASPEIASVLRDLRAELERQRTSTSTLSAPATSSTRSDLSGERDSEVASKLEAAVKRLTEALEQIRSATVAAGSERKPLVIPAQPTAAAMLEGFTALSEAYAPQKRQCQMWTYQQVLDHFGEPLSVFKSGECGVQWFYARPDRGAVSFTFVDGRVCDMHVSPK